MLSDQLSSEASAKTDLRSTRDVHEWLSMAQTRNIKAFQEQYSPRKRELMSESGDTGWLHLAHAGQVDREVGVETSVLRHVLTPDHRARSRGSLVRLRQVASRLSQCVYLATSGLSLSRTTAI